LGADWQNTIYTVTGISKANPGVVTVNPVDPANSMVLTNGMTVTISGVNGMTQVNTNRYIVAGISGSTGSQTFNLYDTFGNPVDTTAFGTFTTSPNAELDVISYPPTAPILNSVNGQVITPGSPAGLQLDIGFEGLLLGSGVLGSNGDVLFWEALYATPTGW
jgi:pyridoxal biosynthesis lyase PdxS